MPPSVLTAFVRHGVMVSDHPQWPRNQANLGVVIGTPSQGPTETDDLKPLWLLRDWVLINWFYK
jgi:hypothetical protein